MFWEHSDSPYWTIIASDWLRTELSCGWRKRKMDDGVARFFTRFGGNLFICWLVGGATLSRRPRMRYKLVELPCEGWWKYIDLTLAYIFDHAVCCNFGPKLASRYKPVENEVKFGLSEPYSAKKRIIVRRSVRSMFGEQTFAQLRREPRTATSTFTQLLRSDAAYAPLSPLCKFVSPAGWLSIGV